MRTVSMRAAWVCAGLFASMCSSQLAAAEGALANPPPKPRTLGLDMAAGAGVGSRAFVVPGPKGADALAHSTFMTASIDLAYRAWPERRASLEIRAAYHTSVGWQIQQHPLFALPQDIAARSQRVELSAAPVMRLAQSPTSPSIALPVGFAVRSFSIELDQFPVRAYLLGAVAARLELRVPLGLRFEVRAAPELQWVLLASRSLRSSALDPNGGLALGGEVGVAALLDPRLRVGLSFRYSRARVPSSTQPLEDSERYLTACIAGAL